MDLPELPEPKEGEDMTTAQFISKCSVWCLDYFVTVFNKSLREIKVSGVKGVSVDDVMQNLHIAHQNFRVVLEDTVEKAAAIALDTKKLKKT